jgi:uncharacterized cupin superfamily protein
MAWQLLGATAMTAFTLPSNLSSFVSIWAPELPAHGQTYHSTRKDLELDRIKPEDVLEGDPVARTLTLSSSPDGRLSSGLWDCTAGKFRWKFWVDEIILVLEGEAVVRESTGAVHELTPGVVAYFPLGVSGQWEVSTYVRKFFVVREAAQTGRIAAARRRLWTALRGSARQGLHAGTPRGTRRSSP